MTSGQGEPIAIDQRQPAEALAVEPQKVERIEDGITAAVQNIFEDAPALGIEHDDLAV